ncbi:hypothetical protein [Adlercreutzia faecimuris]|uniref:Antitoxin n=1 Tax=Adlercreutzia faecimuris TaxID=2897341 RepID=A0ABS9WF51_9ACTN|nr:hypothetical protein [Adlercreutzia sp. JBNU-10]MCI2241506.1 hypothetical protein [Adlercreutzia sp. JBNU-10]
MADNAQSRYEKKALRKVMVAFNRNTEPDLLEFIEGKENMAGYLKSLVRADMEGRVAAPGE